MKRQDSDNYKDWFKKADEDLRAAKVLFRDGGFMDTVGYHIHQAIEKYLKGFLLYNKQDYPFIHNLIILLRECGKYDKGILDYSEECEKVNAYFIESKYPIDPPQDYPKNVMKQSIAGTEFLVKYIRKIVNK